MIFKYRQVIAFLLTLLLYTSVLGALLYNTKQFVSSKPKGETQSIQLTLSQFVEPQIEPEPKPEPIVEPEPITKKKIPIIKKKKKVKKKKKKIKKKKKKKVNASSRQQKESSLSKKHALYNKVRTRIRKYQRLPRMAKIRGLGGKVIATFTITKNGHLQGLTVKGPKLFHAVSKRAIQRAFPISTKQAGIPLPVTLTIPMRYTIR